jgi:hypothetical protein
VQPSSRARAVVSLRWASRWCQAVNGWRSGLDAGSAGVEGGVRWCRGCLAGRDGVHGHAASLVAAAEVSFESGRRGGSRARVRMGSGSFWVGGWCSRPNSCEGLSAATAAPCARVWHQSSACQGWAMGGQPSFVMLSAALKAIRLGPSKMGGCSSCAVQGCRRRTGWWTSSGRRYMGRLHVLLARRRGRLHEARQRLCSVFFVVVRLLLLANPNQFNPRRRSTRPPARSSLRRPRTRQNWDRPCTSGDGRACRSPHIAANPPSTAS